MRLRCRGDYADGLLVRCCCSGHVRAFSERKGSSRARLHLQIRISEGPSRIRRRPDREQAAAAAWTLDCLRCGQARLGSSSQFFTRVDRAGHWHKWFPALAPERQSSRLMVRGEVMRKGLRSGRGASQSPRRAPTGTKRTGGARFTPNRSPQRNYEHYILLARAAALAGKTIEAENYYQHAEHFYRSMAAISQDI